MDLWTSGGVQDRSPEEQLVSVQQRVWGRLSHQSVWEWRGHHQTLFLVCELAQSIATL